MSRNVTEGLPIGAKFRSMARTISEGDFTMLHNLTWQTARLHCDAEYMRRTQFGERIMAGQLVIALLAGLSRTTGYRHVLEEYGATSIALLAYEDVTFQAPVLPGDTLTSETEFIDACPTSKPGRLILRLRDVGFKGDSQVVARGTRVYLYERKT